MGIPRVFSTVLSRKSYCIVFLTLCSLTFEKSDWFSCLPSFTDARFVLALLVARRREPIAASQTGVPVRISVVKLTNLRRRVFRVDPAPTPPRYYQQSSCDPQSTNLPRAVRRARGPMLRPPLTSMQSFWPLVRPRARSMCATLPTVGGSTAGLVRSSCTDAPSSKRDGVF